MSHFSVDVHTDALHMLTVTQRVYPDGDTLNGNALQAELTSLLEAIGLIPGETQEAELFLEMADPWVRRVRKTPFELDHAYLDQPIKQSRKLAKELAQSATKTHSLSDRAAPINLTMTVADLRRMACAKRPLSSNHCRGEARQWLNLMLPRLLPEFIGRHRPPRDHDLIAGLNRRRMPPEDHGKLRSMILDELIPELEHRFKLRKDRSWQAPSKTAWRRTLLLELWELFSKYAPPPEDYLKNRDSQTFRDYQRCFLDFVIAAAGPYVKSEYLDRDAIKRQWRRIRAIQKTLFES